LGTNEYWAEGAQTWFWSNYEYMDGETRVQTPDDLQRYDPKLYELLSRVYAVTGRRKPEKNGHSPVGDSQYHRRRRFPVFSILDRVNSALR
jgi:hypothetical protein